MCEGRRVRQAVGKPRKQASRERGRQQERYHPQKWIHAPTHLCLLSYYFWEIYPIPSLRLLLRDLPWCLSSPSSWPGPKLFYSLPTPYHIPHQTAWSLARAVSLFLLLPVPGISPLCFTFICQINACSLIKTKGGNLAISNEMLNMYFVLKIL